MRKLRLSHTALDTMDKCQYMYYLKYVKRIKPFVPVSYPLVTGVAFHSLVEEMYNTKNFTKEFLVRNWKRHFMNALESASTTFASTKGYEKYLNYGYGIVHTFYAFAKRHGYLKPALETEWKFTIPVENDQGKDFLITGKVDLLRKVGVGLEIVDWKTSWKVPTKAEIAKNKQLTIYDWAVKKVFKVSQTAPSMFYARKSAIRRSNRTVDDHNKILQEFKNMVKIRDKGVYKPNLKSCHWCDFQKHCKHYKKSLTNTP